MINELKKINPNFRQNFSSFNCETDYLTTAELNKLLNFCSVNNYLIIISSAKVFKFINEMQENNNILITLNPIKIAL